MGKFITIFVALAVCFIELSAQNRPVVADLSSRSPLAFASVFDKKGKFIGLTDKNGRMPNVSSADMPATIRYLGFEEQEVTSLNADTVFMRENIFELAELNVEAKQKNVLHILSFVREYSTLSTFTDTVFLFRQKLVDFMVPADPKIRFDGWATPRVLKSESYYRFTDAYGLDSVSNRCNHHFSWSDWVGIIPLVRLPQSVYSSVFSSDTVMGKYSASEIWTKNDDRLNIYVNVLADTLSRKWVPNLSNFFRNNIDFEEFRLHYIYNSVNTETVGPVDLLSYSFNISSNGRGHNMFMFNRSDEPFFVDTYAEGVIIDKKYITLKEARKISKNKNDDVADFNIPSGVPELNRDIKALIARVEGIDNDGVRSALAPDKRIGHRPPDNIGVGTQIFKRLKGMFGIDHINGQRKQSKKWKEFRDGRKQNNQKLPNKR